MKDASSPDMAAVAVLAVAAFAVSRSRADPSDTRAARFVDAVSYGQREYSALGERRVRLHFRGDMQPVEFHQGLLEEALRAVGCPGRVEVRKLSLEEAEYTIEW